ncbi:MAG TPA: CaiB/BaiF CoA-transferase family protein [Alphaproteobacteria bacterium]|nr:CoA transferase [Micavibrio sp.]HQX27416.1 CaiB/BaiF CoA-transferase family protein [Alphaproteobacteria bacterium]
MTKKSLENIRVLDLSRVLAGPYCTQMLGDLGAEIIKIEKPGSGDDTRFWGPPFLKDKDGNDTSESAYYLSINRNKKSVAVDISTKEGQEIIHKLLENSDVLIENFKVGGLKKYGLSYDDLEKKYPKLVYCSITGFGQSGPLAEEPGYDLMAQAMAGLMACTGEPDGAPMKVGVALSDIITGLHAAIGILAALNSREQTGEGQMVDVALVDCTLASLTNLAQYFLTSGKPAPRQGNAHSTIVPYQALETQNGYIVVAVGNNEQFARFCKILGHAEWAKDERFAKNTARVMNRTILIPMIEKEMKKKTSAAWIEEMRGADVPAGPVNRMDEVFAVEQTKHRGMEISMDHVATPKSIKLVGSPLKLSKTPVSYEFAPPVLGQDTQEVLEKVLNLSADKLAGLEKSGVIERAKLKK